MPYLTRCNSEVSVKVGDVKLAKIPYDHVVKLDKKGRGREMFLPVHWPDVLCKSNLWMVLVIVTQSEM